MDFIQELTHIAPSIGYSEGAGGVAGAQTIFGGLKAGYRILHVFSVTLGTVVAVTSDAATVTVTSGLPASGIDLTSEFGEYATADNTIDNTGGTNCTGATLCVLWAKPAANA